MESIERVSVADMIAERIKKKVASGEYKPGEKLPTEKELCELFDVGRSSVREAFRVLQAHGIVNLEPGKGAFVCRGVFDEEDIRNWFADREADLADYMEVRLAVEPYAARLAAERATKKEIEKLGEIFASYHEAVVAKDAQGQAIFEEKFHKQIIYSTGNLVLQRMSESIFSYFVPVLSKIVSLQDTDDIIYFHKELLRAIENRDGEKSETVMREHLLAAQKDIEDATRI